MYSLCILKRLRSIPHSIDSRRMNVHECDSLCNGWYAVVRCSVLHSHVRNVVNTLNCVTGAGARQWPNSTTATQHDLSPTFLRHGKPSGHVKTVLIP